MLTTGLYLHIFADNSYQMNTDRDLLIKFGQRVRTLRKSIDISQEELAYSANVHRTYVGMIERGEKNITLSNIHKLAKALNVKIKDLVDV